MHTERINKWLTLLANFGVLVGIIFLAVEVRQSNRIAISATEISVRSEFRSNSAIPLENDAVAELLVKATDTSAVLTAVEEVRLEEYLWLYINTWMSIEIAYKNGMLPRKTFDLALNDIHRYLEWYPAIRPFVRDFLDSFPEEADTDVYATMRDEMENYE